MPRYIDANKLIELATHEGAYGYVDVHDIYNIPPADVVEVIHCKDCKHFDGDDQAAGKKRCFCYLHGEFRPMEYFCASAERIKTDE